MTPLRIAIIGDHFMKPEYFQRALEAIDGLVFEARTLELDWPDTPMIHGEPGTELEGLREFVGDPDEIADFVDDADVLINHVAPVSAAMLARMPALKLIGVSRGGPVNIDMAAARARGIPVVNAPGRNASAVAEFTIGLILAETRLITLGHRALSQGIWRGDLYREDRTGEELSRQTVGVIGYGHIGTRVVRLLKPFECAILVYDPYVRLTREDAADGVEQTDQMEDLLRRSDVVTLHARVTEETKQFIGRRQFALMRRGAYFINTARGPLVDYDALYEALRSGRLRGAGLETFAAEPPPPDWPLLRLDNVTLTPHIAGSSKLTIARAAEMVAEEVGRFVAGKPALNPA